MYAYIYIFNKLLLFKMYTLQTATANLLGTMRGDDAVGASGNPNTQAGGGGNGRLETIIPQGKELLIEVQNVAGATKYIHWSA